MLCWETLDRPWLLLPGLVLVAAGLLLALTLVSWFRWGRVFYHLPTTSGSFALQLYAKVIQSIVWNTGKHTNFVFFQGIVDLCTSYQRKNCGVFCFFTFWRPIVYCVSPEAVKVILKSSENTHKSEIYRWLKWFEHGLIGSHGAKWKSRRRALTPTFRFRILENFVGVFDAQSRRLVEKLREECKGGEGVDVVPRIALCILDIICETTMGVSMKLQETGYSNFIISNKNATTCFMDRLLRPWLWFDWIFNRTKRGQEFASDYETMSAFTRKLISERKAEVLRTGKEKDRVGKKAPMDQLLEMHLSDPENFTEEDVKEEVDTIVVAGYDTVSVSMNWTLYLLGRHPEVQEKAAEEIERVVGDGPMDAEKVRGLKYIECIVKESQRLFPATPIIGRELATDTKVDGRIIPRGTTCLLNVYVLHRDPVSFPDPEVFDPDRFLPDNSQGRHPFAHVPFSAGPRSCLGQRFAMMEGKVVLANVLRNFRVQSRDPPEKLQVTDEIALRNKAGGIWIKFIPRH